MLAPIALPEGLGVQAKRRRRDDREAKRSNLELLAACLRGEPSINGDWGAVIREANDHLVAPALFSALSASKAHTAVPDEVMTYLSLLHDLNRERNIRLRRQAIEALSALNHVGVEPTLLKGASILVTAPEERLGLRMISDLDLMIVPEQMPQAMKAFYEQGYQSSPGLGEHASASLFRPHDVGTIDIHHRPPGPARFYISLAPLSDEIVEIEGTRARMPAAADRAIHLIVHDMIHDYRLWLGSVDLRHLLDLRDLIRTGQVDWRELRSRLSQARWTSRFALQLALDVIQINLRNLLGVDVPAGVGGSVLSHMLYHRQIILAHHPWIRSIDPIHPGFRVCRKIRTSLGFTS